MQRFLTTFVAVALTAALPGCGQDGTTGTGAGSATQAPIDHPTSEDAVDADSDTASETHAARARRIVAALTSRAERVREQARNRYANQIGTVRDGMASIFDRRIVAARAELAEVIRNRAERDSLTEDEIAILRETVRTQLEEIETWWTTRIGEAVEHVEDDFTTSTASVLADWVTIFAPLSDRLRDSGIRLEETANEAQRALDQWTTHVGRSVDDALVRVDQFWTAFRSNMQSTLDKKLNGLANTIRTGSPSGSSN